MKYGSSATAFTLHGDPLADEELSSLVSMEIGISSLIMTCSRLKSSSDDDSGAVPAAVDASEQRCRFATGPLQLKCLGTV